MKINLGNKILNIKLNVFTEPNFVKLKKELSDYFSEHEINGMKIEEFEVGGEYGHNIAPKEPYFEECLSGGDYEKDLEKIGEKYGILGLGFVPWCYHK